MRVEAAVTSVSWIPSEAVTGLARGAFEAGLVHYDQPPPDRAGAAAELDDAAAADVFRFANRLAGWAEIDDGRIVAAEYAGDSRGVMGGSTLRMGPWSTRVAAVALPALRAPVDRGPAQVTFTQTFGGRAAMPMPRRVAQPPYLQVRAPLVWTTLRLTLHADGRVDHALSGASSFPRHWVYGSDGELSQKSGVADFEHWARTSFGEHSPWGGQDSSALVSAIESALERSVSAVIMRGERPPEIRTLPPGATLTLQGEPRTELYLVLDGVLSVDVDGQELGLLGPGALVGERALLEGGVRTATVTARTPVRVAAAPADTVDREALARISEGHRREAGAGDVPDRRGPD
ncbi:hypothetical protein BH20ACT5_BH20ACT5_26030 [soil metagenome]